MFTMRRGRGRQFEKLVLGAVALAVSALLWMQLLQLGGPNFLSSFSEFSSYPGVEDRRLRKNKDDRGGNDAAAACRVFLQRFHAMNECFRSWLQPCPHQEYTNKQITKAEPLLFYAMMSGQGVGRLMDHAVGTALLAYALQRPFMMDLAWDPHGVLRFLVNAGSYQWYYQDDGGPRHQQWLKLHQTNVTKAINALADKGHNGWVNLPTDLPDILPMSGLYNITNIDKKDLFDPHYRALYTNRAFHEWRRTRDHQILLSPNWGDAWMGNIQLNATQHLDNCPLERATAAVQNALWAPTAALRALFAARRQQVLGTEQQKQSSFGAIHFRTHFMRKELIPPSNKEKVTEEENQRLAEAMADVLEDCATRLADAVTTWWILSDSDEMARAMLAKVQDRQQQLTAAHATNSNGSTTNSTLERFSFLYRSMEGGKHTRVAAQKSLNVDAMVPAMLDWMALGESKIAVVSQSTAFGVSGARGNGKVWRRVCGFSNQPDHWASLKVYESPKASALSPRDQRDMKAYLDAVEKRDAEKLQYMRQRRNRQKNNVASSIQK